MNLQHLRELREHELQQVVSLLPPGSSVLEIGAGAGWQAKALADLGFDVQAIDVAESTYAEHQIWPVQIYDGHRIPFPDRWFDVVFSSNVLEHVPHVEAFQAEIRRVLKPGGIAIHVVPSGSWRFWTSLSHYADLLRNLKGDWEGSCDASLHERARWLARRIRESLLPPRHGERGNVVTEIFFFSRWFWVPFFRRAGWRVVARKSNGLLYTGYQIFALRLSVHARRLLSYLGGSACTIYVLQKGSSNGR